MTHDPRITAHIEKSADFAKPILTHIRALIHQASPDIEEAIKWGMPAFLHNGKQVCNMAAFKAHVILAFWKREAVGDVPDPDEPAIGQFGKLKSLADLPPDADIIAMVHRTIALLESGAKVPRAAPRPRPELDIVPDDLAAALAEIPAAAANFAAFPPGAKREYVEWVLDTKQPATRARRIAQSVEWVAEGKRRNWKYQDC